VVAGQVKKRIFAKIFATCLGTELLQ